MHATSRDLKNWTKVPEDTFFASEKYSSDDFRDSYVIYNEEYKQYWMLITTRQNNMGVIALYTSEDLKKWKDEGVLFTNDMGSDSNMECPSLLKFKGYWYLSFSDQWPSRVVHYRMAKNSKGPFIKPALDHFDGNGFYAGRLEKASNQLYLFGWTPTKVNYDDIQNYDWAGNLVVHNINQKENGELYPTPIEQITKKLNHSVQLSQLNSSETVKIANKNYTFSGKDYESVTFSKLQGINKITGEINLKAKTDRFGFMFNVGDKGKAPLNIMFNSKTNQLEFYNVFTDITTNAEPQSTMALKINEKGTLKFTLLLEDSVAVLYVNNEAVLSTRMFALQNNKWGIFSMNSDIIFSNIELNK